MAQTVTVAAEVVWQGFGKVRGGQRCENLGVIGLWLLWFALVCSSFSQKNGCRPSQMKKKNSFYLVCMACYVGIGNEGSRAWLG